MKREVRERLRLAAARVGHHASVQVGVPVPNRREEGEGGDRDGRREAFLWFFQQAHKLRTTT